jgi:DNA polymerase III epsilon subunit-like protein
MLDKGIKKNMDKYIDLKINNDTTCKKTIHHKFDKIAILNGEIDLIDWTEESLIDIKCSESDFKLEWYIQLLFYYTFLNEEERKKIKYLAIANIMDGKCYKFEIPDINFDTVIQFIELMIKNDQNNYRVSNGLNIKSMEFKFEPDSTLHNKIIANPLENRKNIIILDTETSGFYNDILQLAYVICNDEETIIKSVNKFVKDRIPSIDSTKIHGITKEKIKKEGIDFHEIIKELSKDLDTCEIIVGHNVQFDLNTIKNDIRTYGIHIVDNKGNNKINIFDSVKIIDTLTLAKKKIKLEELYFELFNKKFIGAHDALNDVLVTKDCYFKLIFNK